MPAGALAAFPLDGSVELPPAAMAAAAALGLHVRSRPRESVSLPAMPVKSAAADLAEDAAPAVDAAPPAAGASAQDDLEARVRARLQSGVPLPPKPKQPKAPAPGSAAAKAAARAAAGPATIVSSAFPTFSASAPGGGSPGGAPSTAGPATALGPNNIPLKRVPFQTVTTEEGVFRIVQGIPVRVGSVPGQLRSSPAAAPPSAASAAAAAAARAAAATAGAGVGSASQHTKASPVDLSGSSVVSASTPIPTATLEELLDDKPYASAQEMKEDLRRRGIPDFAVSATSPAYGLNDPAFDYNPRTNPWKLAPRVLQELGHLESIAKPDLVRLAKSTSPYAADESIVYPELDVLEALPPLEVIGAVLNKEIELFTADLEREQRIQANLDQVAKLAAHSDAEAKDRELILAGKPAVGPLKEIMPHMKLDKNAKEVMSMVFGTDAHKSENAALVPYPRSRPDLAIRTQQQFMITAVRAKVKAELAAAKKYPQFVKEYPEFTIPFLHQRRLRMLPADKFLLEPRRKPTFEELGDPKRPLANLIQRRSFKIYLVVLAAGMLSWILMTLWDFHMEMYHGIEPPKWF